MAGKKSEELKELFKALAKIQLDKTEEGLKKMKLDLPGSFEFMRHLVSATSTVVINRNIDDGDAYIEHLESSGAYITPSLRRLTIKEVRERCRGSRRSVDFWMFLSRRLGQCAKLLEYWERVKTIINLAKRIVRLYELKNVPESTNDYIQKARGQMRNMEISKEKMDALIDILKVLNELSPKPIRNYIELTMTAFQKADGTMNICKKHSEEIFKTLREIDRLEEQNRESPNSVGRWTEVIECNPDCLDP